MRPKTCSRSQDRTGHDASGRSGCRRPRSRDRGRTPCADIGCQGEDAALVFDDQDGSVRSSYSGTVLSHRGPRACLHGRIWRSRSRLYPQSPAHKINKIWASDEPDHSIHCSTRMGSPRAACLSATPPAQGRNGASIPGFRGRARIPRRSGRDARPPPIWRSSATRRAPNNRSRSTLIVRSSRRRIPAYASISGCSRRLLPNSGKKKRGKNLEKAFAEVGLNVARLSDPSPRGSKAGALSA